jgi:hypothetical protein
MQDGHKSRRESVKKIAAGEKGQSKPTSARPDPAQRLSPTTTTTSTAFCPVNSPFLGKNAEELSRPS